MVPTRMPETAKTLTSIPACRLLGTPIRNRSFMVFHFNFHWFFLTATYRRKRRSRMMIANRTRKISERVTKVPQAAPTSSRRGNPQLRSEEHTSELQSRENLVCRLLLEKKKANYR